MNCYAYCEKEDCTGCELAVPEHEERPWEPHFKDNRRRQHPRTIEDVWSEKAREEYRRSHDHLHLANYITISGKGA